MTRSPLPLLVALAVGLAAPRPTLAQGASGGLWWEISAGTAVSRLTCEQCDPTRPLAPAVGVALGADASDRLRVGLEGTATANDDDDVREWVYGLGLTGQLHPRPRSGLHLVGGFGWAGYRAESFTYDAVRITVGAGWDLPLLGSWVVGNRLTMDGSAFAALRNSEADVSVYPSVGLSVVRFGVYLRRR